MTWLCTGRLAHAATAAILRSGYLTHKEKAQGDPLATDLSSERVHRAKWVLDGVRQGQPLGALLGYRFERGLHDKGLDRFISRFRALAGLKQQDELGKAYENLRQAETLAEEVGELYGQSREAKARADAARLVKQQRESERKRYQDEVNAINALDQLAKAADAKVVELGNSITRLEAIRPQSRILPNPDNPNSFDIDIRDEPDLGAWTNQIEALGGQRQQALVEARLAHSNFNERVNICRWFGVAATLEGLASGVNFRRNHGMPPQFPSAMPLWDSPSPKPKTSNLWTPNCKLSTNWSMRERRDRGRERLPPCRGQSAPLRRNFGCDRQRRDGPAETGGGAHTAHRNRTHPPRAGVMVVIAEHQ